MQIGCTSKVRTKSVAVDHTHVLVWVIVHAPNKALYLGIPCESFLLSYLHMAA